MTRTTPALLLLGMALGCGGILYTSKEGVTADVQAHLQQTYGEPFVLTRVTNNSNEGTGIVDSHSYSAAPTANPSLDFRGGVTYEHSPPRYWDTYRCALTEAWVTAALQAAIDSPSRRSIRNTVNCRDKKLPFPVPTAGQRLPTESFSWRPTIEVFDDREPEVVYAEVRAELWEASSALGISEVEVEVDLYPPKLSALAERGGPTDPTGMDATESLRHWRRGSARLTADHTGSSEQGRLTAIEQQWTTALAPHMPEGQWEVRVVAMQSSVYRADPQALTLESLPAKSRLWIDVRVAVTAITEEDLASLRTAAIDLFGWHRWKVWVGEYQALDRPAFEIPESYQRGWQCSTYPKVCEPQTAYHIGPGM